ncbi:POLR3K [Piptocephalis cylindrospora]|uniref:DNA-directed RNA polymerase subunit n=1 Tax=Piptocephalis cylindrospora TaxID=1907219 RepID=A0A4P9Y7R8_9FUNG|nr:POLR3K [Piptocephalis cylindrospora]|eukprot:RKP14321.1 POLR3K [Piptocephalis cylindrospora]
MRFCPVCANTLLLRQEEVLLFYCQTCPYIHRVSGTLIDRRTLERKEVDDVLGGAKAWENVDSIAEACPKCENPRAYYRQVQTRSADEPMTVFYKCTNYDCQHQWRER